MDGWEVYKERVQLNGLSSIADWPTPDDTDVPPNCPCPLDDCPLDGAWEFDATIQSSAPPPTGSDTYLDFYSLGDVIQDDDQGGPNDFGYGIVHGPYIVSKSAIKITQGATVSFDWYASDDEDAYDVFGYLLEVSEQLCAAMCVQWRLAILVNTPSRALVLFCTFALGTAGEHREHDHAAQRLGRAD